MQSRVNAQNVKKGTEENLERTKTECAQQSSKKSSDTIIEINQKSALIHSVWPSCQKNGVKFILLLKAFKNHFSFLFSKNYDRFKLWQFRVVEYGSEIRIIESKSCHHKKKEHAYVKAADAYYKLSNTRAQIQSYVFDVIRSSVPKMELDAAFEQKNEIARAVEEELEKAMSAYGYEIVQTLIVDIEPDERVKRAMNEINADTLRVASSDKAEAEKILQIKRAEGDAESKYLAGLGVARQRQAIVDGLRDCVLAFSENVPGTTSKDIMDIMVLITQYFDTMKEIGASSKSNAVFIPHGPGAVQDVASQIRNGLLQGNATNS
ncbi:hypothetical protein PHAVU_002G065600 [Phaseolus vulgaris]|uniref:Band 7 domain-containing protein n=1 Tax=Phaseolus vulgaris TaxID=3885 RepID=V7CKE3_PHAVU|nr:hypothetical protein PHAVU_002G065600g [Phaseolus vulgaris]ESW29376.1 hypothetical protein PHAVU_002G065600g [Phaseolus vulgaris]